MSEAVGDVRQLPGEPQKVVAIDAEYLSGKRFPYQEDIALVDDIDLVAATPGEDINWLEDITLLEEEGVPAVFDRYSNSFIKIYFEIPAGREDEIARKVLIKHLQSGNSYGIMLKERHCKFPQPELGPWVADSATVGTDYKPGGARGLGAAGALRGGSSRSDQPQLGSWPRACQRPQEAALNRNRSRLLVLQHIAFDPRAPMKCRNVNPRLSTRRSPHAGPRSSPRRPIRAGSNRSQDVCAIASTRSLTAPVSGRAKPYSQAAHRAIKAEGGWAAVCTEYAAVSEDSDEAPAIAVNLWDDQDARSARTDVRSGARTRRARGDRATSLGGTRTVRRIASACSRTFTACQRLRAVHRSKGYGAHGHPARSGGVGPRGAARARRRLRHRVRVRSARLPARSVPVAVLQPPHRRVRRLVRESRAVLA